MPTSQQIARIKAKLSSFLTETATIEKRIDDEDSAGVPLNDAWTLVASDVSCRVIDSRSRRSQAWQMVAQSDAMVDMYRIVFPGGTAIEQDYRCTVGSRVYHVVEVTDDRTDGVDLIVHVKRIRGNDG
jgi:hypothetical protein